MKLKKTFNIHIAHTRNNPDNEHHGLITPKDLVRILDNTMFHSAIITKTELNKGLPRWLSKRLAKYTSFTPHIIVTVQKPIFYGIYK